MSSPNEKSENPTKEQISTNANKQKSKLKGSKKHEIYTQGRLTVHLTKGTRISTKEQISTNANKRKSKVKGSKKHETYTQGRLTVHLTKGTRISTKGLTG